MALIKISSLAELNLLGKTLAEILESSGFPPVFMRGELGSGKTALVKAIVSNLKNSDKAETGSPSFNIYNLYPTSPPVFHCDLYRCESNIPEELLNALEEKLNLVLLEWAEFLPDKFKPDDFLDISFNLSHDERLLEITPFGPGSQSLVDKLLKS